MLYFITRHGHRLSLMRVSLVDDDDGDQDIGT